MIDSLFCDFCGSPRIAWVYSADQIVFAEIGAATSDAWAACDPCHRLIEADDRGALAERCIVLRKMPSCCMPIARYVHGGFFKARKGPAVVVIARGQVKP